MCELNDDIITDSSMDMYMDNPVELKAVESAPDVVEPSCCDLIKPLSKIKSREAKWLINGWIPEGHITLLAADGGVGKTTLWSNILAPLSDGRRCILDPAGYSREPVKVMYFSAEDSTATKLKAKIALLEPDEDNVLSVEESKAGMELLRNIKFGSKELHELIHAYQPAICVFDPLQGFIPPTVNMASRNAMRDSLAPLIQLGKECRTAFLIVCHTNKRKGASGRDRISDSADLWDIARSVMMMGRTEEKGIIYLSHEKTNYGELQDTLLLSLDYSGALIHEGTTTKRDRDYMAMAAAAKQTTNKGEQCKKLIMEILQEAPDHAMKSDLLEKALERRGVTRGTFYRHRPDMVREGLIHLYQARENGRNAHYVRLFAAGETPWEEELPFDAENPFLSDPSV